MLIDLYPLPSGSWSFTPNLSRATRVRAPRGSVLRITVLFGPLLFVPAEGDRRQKLPWSANQVFEAAESEESRFRFENRATGPLARRCAG